LRAPGSLQLEYSLRPYRRTRTTAEPASERGDARIAEIEHRSGGEQRANPARAVDEDIPLPTDHPLDAELEIRPGDQDRVGEMALGGLVRFTHIQEHRGIGGPEPCREGLGKDLRHDSAGLLEELTERGHRPSSAYNRPCRGGQEAREE